MSFMSKLVAVSMSVLCDPTIECLSVFLKPAKQLI